MKNDDDGLPPKATIDEIVELSNNTREALADLVLMAEREGLIRASEDECVDFQTIVTDLINAGHVDDVAYTSAMLMSHFLAYEGIPIRRREENL